MFRSLTGRHRRGHPLSSKLVDGNHMIGGIDLASTADDEHDSDSILYSDNDEEAQDFELHCARQLKSLSTTKAWREPSQASSRLAMDAYTSRSARAGTSSSSRRRAKKGNKVREPSPVETIELHPSDYAIRSSELDDIIRAFARKRNPSRSKILVATMKNSSSFDDDASSSSSYNSGFSSSESSNSSEARSATSVLTDTTRRRKLLHFWKQPQIPKIATFGVAHEEANNMKNAVDLADKVDSSFSRYGNNREKRKNNRVANFSGEHQNEYETSSSAGESETMSRHSFSSILSLARSLRGKSIRSVWRSAKRTEKSYADTTEGTAESDTTIPSEFGNVERLNRSTETETAMHSPSQKYNATPKDALVMTSPTATCNLKSDNAAVSTPLIADIFAVSCDAVAEHSRLSFSSSHSLNQSKPKLRSLESFRKNKDVSDRVVPKLKCDPEKTSSAKLEVRGFDCDTGGVATAKNLEMSKVLEPDLTPPNFLNRSSLNMKQFEGSELKPRLQSPEVFLREIRETCGRDRLPTECTQIEHIIDPLDIVLFLTKSDADRKAKRLDHSCDDVSSISSNSTITFSPTSVLGQKDVCFDRPKGDSAAFARQKTFLTTLTLKEIDGTASFSSSSDSVSRSDRPCSQSRTGHEFSNAHLMQRPPSSLAFSPVTAAYAFPSTMRVPTHSKVSILLIEPVLKVFEIVSVRVTRGTTVGDALKDACLAAVDQTLALQTYVSLCSDIKVISNLKSPMSKLAQRKLSSIEAQQQQAEDEEMRREMERRLLVAVPEKSNAAECQKIRRMLWKNSKMKMWWQATYNCRPQP